MNRTKITLLAIWLFVVMSYCLGISLNMANVEKFVFFDNEFSLLSSMIELGSEPSAQNLFLLLIIFTFTLIFPIAKLVTMLLQIKNYGTNWQNRMTRLVEAIGHFSMLDVFLIALMVLLLKLRVLVDVQIYAGFYWFTASIVGSILLSYGIKRQRSNEEND